MVGPEAPLPPASSTPSAPPACRSSARPGSPPSWKAPRTCWQFLLRHIPTAKYQTFSDRRRPRLRRREGAPIVIKADGLAAGKGVVVAMSLDEAHAAIDAMLTHNTLAQYDERGPRVVIEEFMEGEEASFIVMATVATALPLATSQDHKRLGTPTRAPTPAAWAPTRPPRWSRPKSTPARCARSSCRPSPAWPPKVCLPPA